MANRQFAANKEALFGGGKGAAGAGAKTTFTTPAKTTFTTATNAGSRPDQPKRMDLNKLKEAEEYRSKASKALKTSMFGKWKPDYLNAAPYFERAAALYRAGGADEQAKEMFLKAADCNEHCSTFAAAASAYRQAATITKDSDEEEAAKLFAKEADMWAVGGEMGRAADSLLKAAETMEDTSPSNAVDYCLQAVELLCPEGSEPMDLKRAPLASDVFVKSLNLALRNERAKEALTIATKGAVTIKMQNLTSSLYKMYATQTILQLYLGDVVAADKTFMEVHLQDSGYLRASECEVAENLLQAAKEMNAEMLEVAIKTADKAYLDNNIIKLVRRLTLDRISGLIHDDDEEEEEQDDVGNNKSPAVVTTAPPPRRAAGGGRAPVDAEVDLQVDADMELSEEEKAKLRAKPAFPVAMPRPVPAPVPDVFAKKSPTPESPKSGASAGGLMDLSDLQAGLDGGGEDDDFDLDAAIAQARAEAGEADDVEQEAPAVSAPPVSAPPPPPQPAAPQAVEAHRAAPPLPPPPAPTSLPSAPSKPPKRSQVEKQPSNSFAYDVTSGPYSPGYEIAAPPAPAPAPAPAQQEDDDDDDFLR